MSYPHEKISTSAAPRYCDLLVRRRIRTFGAEGSQRPSCHRRGSCCRPLEECLPGSPPARSAHRPPHCPKRSGWPPHPGPWRVELLSAVDLAKYCATVLHFWCCGTLRRGSLKRGSTEQSSGRRGGKKRVEHCCHVCFVTPPELLLTSSISKSRSNVQIMVVSSFYRTSKIIGSRNRGLLQALSTARWACLVWHVHTLPSFHNKQNYMYSNKLRTKIGVSLLRGSRKSSGVVDRAETTLRLGIVIDCWPASLNYSTSWQKEASFFPWCLWWLYWRLACLVSTQQ